MIWYTDLTSNHLWRKIFPLLLSLVLPYSTPCLRLFMVIMTFKSFISRLHENKRDFKRHKLWIHTQFLQKRLISAPYGYTNSRSTCNSFSLSGETSLVWDTKLHKDPNRRGWPLCVCDQYPLLKAVCYYSLPINRSCFVYVAVVV